MLRENSMNENNLTLIDAAIVRINPANDPAVKMLADEASLIQGYATARIIITDADMKLATDDLAILQRLKKSIEEKRKEYTGPINEHLKAVNDAFKTITIPLENADVVTRTKILDYRHIQERRAKEAEEINRLRLEAARKEMELKGELTESVVVIEVPQVQPKTVQADNSFSSTVKIPKFEVEDIKLVPVEFLIVDMAALGKQVRAGRRNIPGVRIWMIDSLRVSTRE
jgi:hypothetical protein